MPCPRSLPLALPHGLPKVNSITPKPRDSPRNQTLYTRPRRADRSPVGYSLEQPQLSLVRGGAASLSAEQRAAVTLLTGVVRALPPRQLVTLLRLVQELRKEHFLDQIRETDIPALRILAEVISGWDEDGVFEFARAWTSTLIAREDGFNWATADSEEKACHRERITEELVRRGLANW